jgi:hypothetical protein
MKGWKEADENNPFEENDDAFDDVWMVVIHHRMR